MILPRKGKGSSQPTKTGETAARIEPDRSISQSEVTSRSLSPLRERCGGIYDKDQSVEEPGEGKRSRTVRKWQWGR